MIYHMKYIYLFFYVNINPYDISYEIHIFIFLCEHKSISYEQHIDMNSIFNNYY